MTCVKVGNFEGEADNLTGDNLVRFNGCFVSCYRKIV